MQGGGFADLRGEAEKQARMLAGTVASRSPIRLTERNVGPQIIPEQPVGIAEASGAPPGPQKRSRVEYARPLLKL